MISRCYTKVQNQYEPINAVAADTIRCLACNHFFSPSLLAQHLKTHISPSHQRIAPKAVQAKKINLRKLIEEKGDVEIDIKSVQPMDMPNPELKKKQVVSVEDPQSKLDNSFSTEEYTLNILQDQIFPQIIMEEYENQNYEKEQVLNLGKKIPLNVENVVQNEKGIHMYKNQKDLRTQDKGGSGLKKLFKHSKSKSVYAVQRISSLQAQVPEQPVVKPQPHKYQLKNSVKYPRKTFTTETKIKRTTDSKSRQDDRDNLVTQSKFQCPECKGFYCDYCKSTVPPIYRPIPDEKGEYHFHPNRQSIEMYKKVYGTNACLSCSYKYRQ